MIPPKYNFYIGSRDKSIVLYETSIDDNGKYVDNIDNVQAYEINTVKPGYMRVLISNLINGEKDNFSTIYFFDKDMNLISKIIVSDYLIIQPPKNAYYYSMRYAYYSVSAINNKRKPLTGEEVCFVHSVNPHYKELNKKYAKESGQEFFRVSIDGKITLFGDDYDIIKNSSLEDRMVFIIDKYNTISKAWVEYYNSEFNKADCKLNYDKKSCEIKTSVLDNYINILNKYDSTYDLIKLAPEISRISLHKRPLMQVYIKGANSISNYFGGIYWEDDINEAIDSHDDLINKYYFAYIKAGNEFYIKNAGISDVNGVYAGMDGYWSKWNPAYTCKMELVDGSSFMYWIRLYRNSDNVLLYQSEKQYAAEVDNKYIGREDIKMINVNNWSDTFIIESPFVYHIYRRLLCDVDKIDYSGGTVTTYNLPPDDFVTDNRNYKKCIGLTGGMFFCTSRTVSEPTKYGVNDYNEYFTNKFISSTVINRPLPISRNSWVNASLWYVYDLDFENFEENATKKFILKDSYSIAAVIKALIKEIDPSIQHEGTAEYSRFLYDNNVPMPMQRFYVYITQKTNILKGEYDRPAQKAEISFEDVMKMLRDCFRCYWYIEDNKLKIEHISFFMNSGSYSYNADTQLDFTKLTDQFNKKLSSYFQSEVEYDKSDLSHRYEFNWMDDVTDLFGNISIDVNSNYIQKDKTEEINISQFSSDIDYMLFNPSNFSDDGFALLCPIENERTLELPIVKAQLIDENNDAYYAVIQNFYASWAYLVRFYMKDMPAKNIKCNALNNLYVDDVKMCMKHDIEFLSEEDLDGLKLIKTNIGNGKIDEISINMNSRLTKVKLSYRPN